MHKVVISIPAVLQTELGLDCVPAFFWTDSMIVLGYITNVTRRFHTYVENQVSIIPSLTDLFFFLYFNQEDHNTSSCAQIKS